MGGRIGEELDGVLKLLPVCATKYVHVLGKGADTGGCSCMSQVRHFLPGGSMNVEAVVALECDEEDELVSVVGEARVSLIIANRFLSLPPDREQFTLVIHREDPEVIRLVFDLKQLVATHLARDVTKVTKIWVSMALICPDFASAGTACNDLLLHGLSGDVFGEEKHLSQGEAGLHSAHTRVVPPLVKPLHSLLLEARQKTESDSHGAIRLEKSCAFLLRRVSPESFSLAMNSFEFLLDQAISYFLHAPHLAHLGQDL